MFDSSMLLLVAFGIVMLFNVAYLGSKLLHAAGFSIVRSPHVQEGPITTPLPPPPTAPLHDVQPGGPTMSADMVPTAALFNLRDKVADLEKNNALLYQRALMLDASLMDVQRKLDETKLLLLEKERELEILKRGLGR